MTSIPDRPNSKRRAALVGLFAFFMGYLGQGHGTFAYIDRLTTDTIAPIPAQNITTPPVAKPAGRIWILFIDGLGFDRAEGLPNLTELRKKGLSRPMIADFFSMTYAGTTTMVTGVPPRHSGVRLNDIGPWAPLDSINARASDAGIEVLISPENFTDFPNLMRVRNHRIVDRDEGLEAPPDQRALWWVYFEGVDIAGHHHGADDPSYAQAARKADALLGRLMGAIDPARDALVVVSDHGHLASGGHGGTEPEVLGALFAAWGGPFRSDGAALPPAPMRDLAPTLAVAMGIDPPLHSMGSPMLDTLGKGPTRPLAQTLELDAEATARFDQNALDRLILWSTIWLAVLLGALALHRRGTVRLIWRDAWPALIYTSIYCGLYLILGHRWSWSIGRGRIVFVIETALAALIALVVALKVARRDRRPEEALVAALLLGTPYTLNSAWAGLDMRDIAGPWASFGMVFWSTLNFYVLIALGVRSMLDARSPRHRDGA